MAEAERGKYTDLAKRFVEGIKSTGLFGRPYEETPIGIFGSMRGRPLEEQLKVSESDPAWGFAGTTVGKGIRAFHGSPHSFDKFDLGKIGTGEGAQAYGHGLYFAENENVARAYREALSPGVPSTLSYAGPDRARNAASMLASETPEEDVINALTALGDKSPQVSLEAGRKILEEARKSGHMYEVNINASPDEFLDWDKPLSEQSDAVLGALSDRGIKYDAVGMKRFDDALHAALTGDATPNLPKQPWNPTGPEIYKAAMRNAVIDAGLGRWSSGGVKAGAPAASAWMNDVGIPGIKYLDQGSRAAGDGSRNYVVFNPSLIEIMRKYGVLAPTATLGGMAYGTRNNQTGVQ